MERARVLVIDDDPLLRSLITSILRREYLVSVASDGADGYRKALEHPPQLVIVDVQMPGWDGLRTVQAIRANPALSQIPLMMLTSDATRQTVLAAIQEGANDYVIKTTLCPNELLMKARHLIGLDPSRVNPQIAERRSGKESAVSPGPADPVIR
jgi:DNA-binding response OmpR family regulator